MRSCWFFSLLPGSRNCFTFRHACTCGALSRCFCRKSSLYCERSVEAGSIGSNSAAMTSWILRSGASVCVRNVFPSRIACSWVVGSEGESAWDANSVRRARRYFSWGMLAHLIGSNENRGTLTSAKKDLEAHLLCLGVLRTKFEERGDEFHGLYQRLRGL